MGPLTGLLLLARFRPEGIAAFAATPQAFLNSLAPPLALALVSGLGLLLGGHLRGFLLQMLANIVALLAPPTLSHLLARRWGREPLWLRYVVAGNWVNAATALASLLIVQMAAPARGEQPSGPMVVALLAVAAYSLAVQWYLLWRGLAVTRVQATLGMLGIGFGTGVLVVGLAMLAAVLR